MRGAATAALAKLTSTEKVESTTALSVLLDVALLIVSANARLLLWQKSASPLLSLAIILTSMLVYISHEEIGKDVKVMECINYGDLGRGTEGKRAREGERKRERRGK